MSAAAIAFTNLADAATASISASSAVTLAPVSLLQNGHVSRVWATANGITTANIDVDFGSNLAWDTVMLAGMNMTSGGTTRVRASTVGSGGGDVYDSGSAAGRVTVDYGTLVILRPNSNVARWLRIDLTDASLSRLEAGRLFVGLRNTFEVNFDPGFAVQSNNISPRTFGVYGNTFIDRRPGYRSLDAQFTWVTLAERNGFVQTLENKYRNDGHVDVLFIADPASTDLPRDSLWGYFEADTPIVEPAEVAPRKFTKTYRIRERL